MTLVNVPYRGLTVCRNIKQLFNFEPPATDAEIRDAALQFVRKLSGTTRPSKANEAAFARAVDDVAQAAESLLGALVTNATPRDRAVEAERARALRVKRFGARGHVAHPSEIVTRHAPTDERS